MFGKDRLRQIVTQNNNAAAAEICSRVIDEVAHFCGPAPQLDDITLIVISAI
ncbi:MAG: SpoIIE family protein phosphatase [Phycisphaerae bacterium]|nr:SpoIIE family protein phosphatase [Phycisphaerae bacterium]